MSQTVTALIRLADVYEVPLATNMGTGEVLVRGLERGDMTWRNIVRGDTNNNVLE